jgi:UDP-2-acetamido-2-deoxy-ribo-hexuluronate aminotransferase
MALNIKPGDEIVTTPFTFVATAEMIVLIGAKPVFVDVEPETGNLDPLKLEMAITSRTRAIMPVSLYGQTADMDEINAIAGRHGLPVIEDAAQSFGAEYRGRKSCNLSEIGCTSFFPSKPLGCYGDGGAIFTSDDLVAKACREIRVHGQEKRYYHTRVGVGGRMDTLQCAVVLAKLERFDWERQSRVEVGQRYTKMLATGRSPARPMAVREDRSCMYAQYTVSVENRDEVQRRLKSLGIPTAVHYPIPVHKQPAYTAYLAHEGCSVSTLLGQRVLSLPMHPYLETAEQEKIVASLNSVMAGPSRAAVRA